MPTTLKLVRAALLQVKPVLLAYPGVVGVGIGKTEDNYRIKVNLREQLPEKYPKLVSSNGVEIHYEVVGKIVPLGSGVL